MIGCLLNPDNPNTEAHTREAQEAAHTIGRKLELLHARNETEIETAFATLVQKGVSALVVVPDGFFNSRPEQFVALAAQTMDCSRITHRNLTLGPISLVAIFCSDGLN